MSSIITTHKDMSGVIWWTQGRLKHRTWLKTVDTGKKYVAKMTRGNLNG